MKKYVTYTVQIPIEAGGEMAKRIEDLAKSRNMLPEDVVASIVQLGVYGHMEGNMTLYEKSPSN